MKHKTAPVPNSSPMEKKSVPFSEIPDQTKLFLDYQTNTGNYYDFYPEKNTPLEQFAEKVLENYKVDREKLCDILLEENKGFGGDIKTFINIKKLRKKDCVTVVTGQQAGLFTGPLYTIYKALSAIKLAEELTRKNINAVPVFWIAEEDHDFEEINHTFAVDAEGRLQKFQNTPKNYKENVPVGFVELDNSIDKTIKNLFMSLPKTEFTEELKDLIEGTYKSRETFGVSFAKLLSKILKGYGLIILPALNRELKQLCSPIFTEAIKKTDSIISAILEKNKKLEAADYHCQVLVEENSFPFFAQSDESERLALRRDLDSGKIIIQKTKEKTDFAEILEVAEKYPRLLSPNALLRPVIQDYLLPTITYFGGGAEIAYFAQNSAVYETLERPATPIRHRSSFTIIRGKNRRNLNNYDLKFLDLFEGEEKITSKIVEEFLSNDVAMTFADVEDEINKQLKLLEQSLNNTEPTLADNAANRHKKIMWHIAALRKKYHRAEILKDEIAQRRIQFLFSEVLPGETLQERTLNIFYFLNFYGSNFVKWLHDSIETEEKGHQLLFL